MLFKISNSDFLYFQPVSIDLNPTSINSFMTAISVAPAQIERDSDGRPIRRGYIPVEEKIQRELREMKNREQELKKLRKEVKAKKHTTNSDILMNDEDYSSDESDDDDEEEEFAFDYPPPGKLRSSKSISELCDALGNSSLSPR